MNGKEVAIKNETLSPAVKLIIYYNLRDSRQVSYIEAIGASSEIENLRPVQDNKKTAVECSTADKNGGA